MSCSNTLAALVKRSPDSPTQMLTHSLRMRSARIGFLNLSFGSFFSFFILPCLVGLAASLVGFGAYFPHTCKNNILGLISSENDKHGRFELITYHDFLFLGIRLFQLVKEKNERGFARRRVFSLLSNASSKQCMYSLQAYV